MGPTLEALHRLQELELQLSEVRGAIERKRRVAVRQEQKIKELDTAVHEHEALLRKQQMETDRLDLDVKSREVNIAKLRVNLNQIKTNKEYSALLTQLNTEKADNGKIEERVLGLLAELDAKRAEIQALNDVLAKEAERLKEMQAAVRTAEDQNRARLAKLTTERKAASSALPASTVALFDRVAGKNEGQALAQVVRTNPKREEYACQGCNMAINIEQVNALMSRDEPILCNICGRILYIESAAVGRA